MGNYKDSKIQLLAEKGNGNFAYLDSEREAEKVLMKEFAQTLYTVADDVYMYVNFMPRYTRQYRLIGFDNKAGALLDSLSAIEGGELGSGHTLTALFEVEPTDSLLLLQRGNYLDTLVTAELQYRYPSDSVLHYESIPLLTRQALSLDELKQHQFNAAVALFGLLLKESPYVRSYSWNDLVTLVQQVADPANPLQAEFVQLVQQAREMYGKKKGRRAARQRY